MDLISYTANIGGLNTNISSGVVSDIAKDQIMKEGNDKQILIFGWIIALLLSSLFSLMIGTVLGLTQFRIKRLLALNISCEL